jgi:hypothetical protein
MPRVPGGAAVIIALVIATVGYGAVSTSLSLVSTTPTASIGTEVPVGVGFNGGGPDFKVILFAGTEHGSTTLTFGDGKLTIPVAGNVFQAGAGVLATPSISVAALIPEDLLLVRETIIWVAVVLNAEGKVVAVAKTGGPVIEDAIC